MATFSFVGYSTKRDSYAAGLDAAQQCFEKSKNLPISCIIVFGTTGYNQDKLISGINHFFPDSPLVGCSAAGVIATSISDESAFAVTVMTISSDSNSFENYIEENFLETEVCAQNLLNKLNINEKPDIQALLLFTDCFNGNSGKFVEIIDNAVNQRFPIIGGVAGDIVHFSKTYQYFNNKSFTNSVSALLFRGNLILDIAVSHANTPIGLDLMVTKSNGFEVEEIDNKNAYDVFAEYGIYKNNENFNVSDIQLLCVGKKIEVSNSLNSYGDIIVRSAMGMNKEKKSILFPGGLAEGDIINITHWEPEKIKESALFISKQISDRHPFKKPLFVIHIDCSGRGKEFFGDKVSSEIIAPIQKNFGSPIPWIGFHSFGEIAPIEGNTYFHNCTIVLCAFYEKD